MIGWHHNFFFVVAIKFSPSVYIYMEQIKSEILENTTERRNKSTLQILYNIALKIIGW